VAATRGISATNLVESRTVDGSVDGRKPLTDHRDRQHRPSCRRQCRYGQEARRR
jgi:hypothetical protein